MEVIEGEAVRLSDEPAQPEVIEVNAGFHGGTPFFLVIEFAEQRAEGNLGIDLDSPWLTTYKEYLRSPGVWWLFHKATGQPVLAVVVNEGDQPYFTKHHIGNLMSHAELSTYGLGKKCADGTMVRLWAMPNGCVVGGDDVDPIGSRMLG